jgi:hypothetical protein
VLVSSGERLKKFVRPALSSAGGWRAGGGDHVAELLAAGDPELGVGPVQVRADRAGEEEPVADLAVGQAVAGQATI